MKTIALLATIILASCAPRAYQPGPNPLDEPGYVQPTAGELHAENIKTIRGITR
jgi:hypothetical protein